MMWKNLTEISDGNITVKMTSSGGANIEKSKGCYIASLCYGSSESQEVILLKRYRDEVLSKHLLGRAFIKSYYLFSPKLVALLYKRSNINSVIRDFILAPIIFRLTRNKKY